MAKVLKTDVLVIGAGIAGLSFAIKCAEDSPRCQVTVLTKSSTIQNSNTYYAQGGIAAVWDKEQDTLQKHIDDTLASGDGLCDVDVVKMVVEGAEERIKELINWGTAFDKNGDDYDLTREGGHSLNRILHHKDVTGREIVRALYEKAGRLPNITFLNGYFAMDFIVDNGTCQGCTVLNQKTNEMKVVLSCVTLCATGAVGQAYKTTTNPSVATGDGIAMAHRSGAEIENMAYVQFHPTAFYDADKKDGQDFLISEAVRGEGAVLKTPNGESFMESYDDRGSLAPRDVVARAIDAEMKKHKSPCMYLDCSVIPEEKFKAHFPTIYEYCMLHAINPMKDMIPIAPACHYMCGGIKVDKQARTNIKNLLAAGECASTGLHGANRLASNSLLEAAVYAHQAFEGSKETLKGLKTMPENMFLNVDHKSIQQVEEVSGIRQKIQNIMSANVGIVRSDASLKKAIKQLEPLQTKLELLYQASKFSIDLLETRNLANVAMLIMQEALSLKENRGLHYSVDSVAKTAVA